MCAVPPAGALKQTQSGWQGTSGAVTTQSNGVESEVLYNAVTAPGSYTKDT